MSDMIERVARVLCEYDGEWPDQQQRYGGWRWQEYADAAMAAIGAMREPTVAMKQAGQDFRKSLSWEETEDLLGAIVDAALLREDDE